jgi:hypothetical protein
MKASLKLTVLASIVLAFAAGLFAAAPLGVNQLPPLSSSARETLVEFYRQSAKAQAWWAEYYAMNDHERAYRAGTEYGLQVAAYHLETYTEPSAIAQPPRTDRNATR